LNRMKSIDFLSYLILLYLLLIMVIREYIHDIGGFKNLSGSNEFQPIILIFIFILLLTPWFIKYQNNQRYRKIELSLNNSTDQLKDEF
jgi:pilus assembly protein TadC